VPPVIVHFLPQLPQLSTFDVVLTHAPPQHDSPVGHGLLSLHPRLHTLPAHR
jgi:hypothetical protein